MNFTATIRDPSLPPPTHTHTLPSWSSSASTKKSPAVGGQRRSRTLCRRTRWRGTPWSTGSKRAPSCRSSMLLCRRWGDWLVAVLKAFDFPVPEQVIKAPKKSKSSRRCRVPDFRFVPMEHQTGEQLVEMPTVVSFSSLQRTAEQSIDIPGTGRRPGGGGGLQSLHPGHSSTALVGEQIADIPVPRGRRGLGGFLQDRIQQRLCRSRFQFLTVVSMIFSQDRVQELHPQVLALWSEKKCGVRQPVRSSPGRLFFSCRSRRGLQLTQNIRSVLHCFVLQCSVKMTLLQDAAKT